jgi:hypothetical protein
VKSSAPVVVRASSAVLVAAGATRSHSPKKPEHICCHVSIVFVPRVLVGLHLMAEMCPAAVLQEMKATTARIMPIASTVCPAAVVSCASSVN